jgi:hypothetical protein
MNLETSSERHFLFNLLHDLFCKEKDMTGRVTKEVSTGVKLKTALLLRWALLGRAQARR